MCKIYLTINNFIKKDDKLIKYLLNHTEINYKTIKYIDSYIFQINENICIFVKNKFMIQNTTICAIATAPGGALGIIRISGENAISYVNNITVSDKILSINGYTIIFDKIIDTDNTIIDEVLISVFKNPHSYTGENLVEISCHGSSYIMQRIMERLISVGCVQAGPGEFTMRAFINGKLDLSQAEAVADIISSTNKASHDIAIKQLKGSFKNELTILQEKLLQICSLLELELDFSEEDVEFADRTQLLNIASELKNKIEKLITSFKYGNAIKNGVPVAIIGAPNVGKSTLLNKLLGEEKAIISNIPGTTRDIIEDTINIDGICFRFVDTAGIRDTDDPIEKMGIERSKKAINTADIIILMKDTETDFLNIGELSNKKIIRITNKTNEFSALNNIGIEELKEKLKSYVDFNTNNEVIINNIRHAELLSLALSDLINVITNINNNISGDLIAEDLHLCINHLSEITGQITSDDILHNIFSHFCIGK